MSNRYTAPQPAPHGRLAPSARPDRSRTLCSRRIARQRSPARPLPQRGFRRSSVRTCAAVPRGEMRCFALHRTTGVIPHLPANVNPAVAVSGYGPSDLASAYNVPTTPAPARPSRSSTPTTTRMPEPISATYRSEFSLPGVYGANGCFRQVNQNGATAPFRRTNTGWSGEEIRSTSRWSRPSARTATSCSSREQPDNRQLGPPSNEAVRWARSSVSNSYGGSRVSE